MKNKHNFSDKSRNNYVSMITHHIVVIFMLLLCLASTAQGQKTWGYFILCLVIGMASPAAEVICFKRDPESSAIKHLLSFGFAIFYTFALFTSDTYILFLFVIPLLVVITIYNDTKYSLLVNIGTIIEAILVFAIGSQSGKYGYNGIDNAFICVSVMILIGLFSIIAAQVINKNLTDKIKKLQHVSEITQSEISGIYEELEKLNTSSAATRSAMTEVTSGTSDTSEAVLNQLTQTESINNQVDVVNNSARTMAEQIKKTLESVNTGNDDVAELVEKVNLSVSTSASAVTKLNQLTDSMAEMNNIIKLIDNIAFQTNILALNANVEAARAGDAGRGFSVVASQVSEMSIQTKDATESISDMISKISDSINDVVNVMNKIIAEVEDEKGSAAKTTDSFFDIKEQATLMQDVIDKLSVDLSILTKANHGILDSTHRISSASEEVSSLAKEAMGHEEQNSDILANISKRMETLLDAASN